MKFKKYIFLAIILALIVLGFIVFSSDKPVANENTAASVRVLASSTNYVLLEEETMFEEEEEQSKQVKADQSIFERFKRLFDE